MIVNPYTETLAVFSGTRLLKSTFGLVGESIPDRHDSNRRWVIHGLYAPITKRALGGIRAKLLDQSGVVTFCNQRDLEVLLGLGVPGARCKWYEGEYQRVGSNNWFGFCMDTDDCDDDLMDHELLLKLSFNGIVPSGAEVQRTLHLDEDDEVEEILVFSWNMNYAGGISPNGSVNMLHERWTRTYSKRVL